jgi:hypothetical protein
MSEFITDLDKSKPTEFDPVADGAAEIRSIKSALRDTFPYANTPLTVSNEAIVDAVNSVNAGGSSQLAHAKWGPEGMSYAVNVESITETSKGNFTIKFARTIANYDYMIAITPAAVNGRPVIAYVTSQALLNDGGDPNNINDYTPNGFTMQIREFNPQGVLELPPSKGRSGFTFLVVDNDSFGD